MSRPPFKNHPAFPVTPSEEFRGNTGMSMHDYFVAHVPDSLVEGASTTREAADIAVSYADEIMQLRDERNIR